MPWGIDGVYVRLPWQPFHLVLMTRLSHESPSGVGQERRSRAFYHGANEGGAELFK